MQSGGPATLLTTSKKKIKNIAIFLKDADDSEEEEKENKSGGREGKVRRKTSTFPAFLFVFSFLPSSRRAASPTQSSSVAGSALPFWSRS